MKPRTPSILLVAALGVVSTPRSEASEKSVILDDKVATAIGGDSLWTRDTLLGDWGGLRPALGERGIAWDISHTTFYTGFLDGGPRDNDFEFSHRFDALADLLLVDDNPLENLKLFNEPEKNLLVIMKDGKIYKNTL